jgi:prepilin-type processing-associated H-X9-DG protein
MPKLIRSDWIADPADNAMLAKLYSTINTVENRNDDLTLPLFRVDSGPDAWNDEVTLHHLHEGIERFFITDINNPRQGKTIQSVIPIMWDPIFDNAGISYFNHIPGGSNVLYMDGHVEFVQYPAVHSQSTWPISSASIDNRLEDESW